MKSRTVMLLAIGVVVLFAAMFALNYNGRDDSTDAGLLLPELKRNLNGINAVTITSADDTVTVRNENGRWIVPHKSGYPADTAKLRTLLLALADARRIEQKTSNPEMYEHLGVEDPAADGSGGVLVSATGNGEDLGPYAAILGDPAQGGYRYARLPDEAESWLIDRNPQVPAGVGGWLSPAIVDLPSARIRTTEIRHADGETIRIVKEAPEDSSFRVENIPDGRELSYASVADSIAGVLGNLTLDDVREAPPREPQEHATVSFTTFDGLGIEVAVYRDDSGNDDGEEAGDTPAWIALEASPVASPEDAPPADEAAAASGSAAGDMDDAAATDNGAGDHAVTAEGDDDAAPAAGEPGMSPREEADAINERVAGWQYRIPDYKARQLTRRWEDLLSDRDE